MKLNNKTFVFGLSFYLQLMQVGLVCAADDQAKPVKLITKAEFAQACQVAALPKGLVDLIHAYAAGHITLIPQREADEACALGFVQHNGVTMIGIAGPAHYEMDPWTQKRVPIGESIQYLDPNTLLGWCHKHHHHPPDPIMLDLVGCGNNIAATRDLLGNLAIFTTDGSKRLDHYRNNLLALRGGDGVIVALRKKSGRTDEPELAKSDGVNEPIIPVFTMPGTVLGMCFKDKNGGVVATDKRVWEINNVDRTWKPSPIKLSPKLPKLSGILPIEVRGEMRVVGSHAQGICALDGKEMPIITCDESDDCGDNRALVQCGAGRVAHAQDNTVRVYDLATGMCEDSFVLKSGMKYGYEESSQNAAVDKVREIVATPDGSLLVARTFAQIAIIRRGGMWAEVEKKSDAATSQ